MYSSILYSSVVEQSIRQLTADYGGQARLKGGPVNGTRHEGSPLLKVQLLYYLHCSLSYLILLSSLGNWKPSLSKAEFGEHCTIWHFNHKSIKSFHYKSMHNIPDCWWNIHSPFWKMSFYSSSWFDKILICIVLVSFACSRIIHWSPDLTSLNTRRIKWVSLLVCLFWMLSYNSYLPRLIYGFAILRVEIKYSWMT